MGFVDQLAFKSIAHTLFLHNMNIERLHQQPDESPDFKMMIVLYQKFIAIAENRHFVMYAFKDRRLHHTGQLRRFRNRKDVKVFRTDHYVHGHVLAKTFVYTLEFGITETYQFVVDHHSVQDITFSDEIGYKRIDRLVIYIDRSTNLLDASLAHDYNRIA